jgi:hypothetical protein
MALILPVGPTCVSRQYHDSETPERPRTFWREPVGRAADKL